MMKKLLSCLFVAGATVFGAYAQTEIAGNYVGELNVNVAAEDQEPVANQSISLTKEDGGTYALSIKDFSFMNIPIGDLTVGGLTAAEEAGATVLTSAVEVITGPVVGGTIPTTLSLVSATVMNSSLELELDVTAGEGDAAIPVVVGFTGTKQASGIANTEADRMSIFVNGNAIEIEGNAAQYAIFNTAGAMVQQGAVSNNTIDITGLKGGIYVMKADNHIAKFIKK